MTYATRTLWVYISYPLPLLIAFIILFSLQFFLLVCLHMFLSITSMLICHKNIIPATKTVRIGAYFHFPFTDRKCIFVYTNVMSLFDGLVHFCLQRGQMIILYIQTYWIMNSLQVWSRGKLRMSSNCTLWPLCTNLLFNVFGCRLFYK